MPVGAITSRQCGSRSREVCLPRYIAQSAQSRTACLSWALWPRARGRSPRQLLLDISRRSTPSPFCGSTNASPGARMSDQTPKEGELILYRTANDAVRVEVLYESKTFWLDGVDVRTVSDHLRNVYGSGELSEEATLRKLRMVRTEGGREVARDIVFYHLGAIINRLPGQQC